MSQSEVIKLAILAGEEALGENLVWLSDKLDLSIRQGDKETISRLNALNEAWRYLAIAKATLK